MDYVKGSRILRERIGRHRPVEPEYSDAIVSQAATARIRRWIGAETAPASEWNMDQFRRDLQNIVGNPQDGPAR